MAKAAKAVEHSSVESFRDTARREYEQRRADGRLVQAQRTCQARDEAASKTVRALGPFFICFRAGLTIVAPGSSACCG